MLVGSKPRCMVCKLELLACLAHVQKEYTEGATTRGKWMFGYVEPSAPLVVAATVHQMHGDAAESDSKGCPSRNIGAAVANFPCIWRKLCWWPHQWHLKAADMSYCSKMQEGLAHHLALAQEVAQGKVQHPGLRRVCHQPLPMHCCRHP